MPDAEPLLSDWYLIDQPMVNRFADAIDDHQFIHTDPVRAHAETNYGGTIVHGFFLLSLLTRFGQ
jgi:acyl dehydratase